MSTETIKSQVVSIKAVIASLQAHDLSPCYDLASRLKNDPELLAAFAKDPLKVAKEEVGYEPPTGLHMHFIDERLTLIPPEGSETAQILSKSPGETWSRIEVRSGIGPMCVILCGECNEA